MNNLSWRPSDAPKSHLIFPKLFPPHKEVPMQIESKFLNLF
jgi:hypothetical protein